MVSVEERGKIKCVREKEKENANLRSKEQERKYFIVYLAF